MGRKLLLIDFENVQRFDLSRIGEDVDVLIFVGAAQKNMPIALAAGAQKLGGRLHYQQVEGNGRNALDFHIACHLGRVLERNRGQDCYVLSHDTGFDPLLKYLGKQGLKCRRIGSLAELGGAPAAPQEAKHKRVVDALQKISKNKRPRKRATLTQFVASLFQKNISAVEIDAIIARLKANKLLSERDGTISYG